MEGVSMARARIVTVDDLDPKTRAELAAIFRRGLARRAARLAANGPADNPEPVGPRWPTDANHDLTESRDA